MRKSVLAVALVVLFGAARAADDDAAKKDLKKLEGTWQITSQVANGKEAPEEKLKGMTATFDASGKWKVKQSDKVVLEGTVKLDPSKKPKAADWTVTSEGDLKDQKVLGIYEVDRDTFRHCYHASDRPEKFESKEDSRVTYTVFKRVKKDKK